MGIVTEFNDLEVYKEYQSFWLEFMDSETQRFSVWERDLENITTYGYQHWNIHFA